MHYLPASHTIRVRLSPESGTIPLRSALRKAEQMNMKRLLSREHMCSLINSQYTSVQAGHHQAILEGSINGDEIHILYNTTTVAAWSKA
jgi:hypothetical protein